MRRPYQAGCRAGSGLGGGWGVEAVGREGWWRWPQPQSRPRPVPSSPLWAGPSCTLWALNQCAEILLETAIWGLTIGCPEAWVVGRETMREQPGTRGTVSGGRRGPGPQSQQCIGGGGGEEPTLRVPEGRRRRTLATD